MSDLKDLSKALSCSETTLRKHLQHAGLALLVDEAERIQHREMMASKDACVLIPPPPSTGVCRDHREHSPSRCGPGPARAWENP